jgi:frataxin-like iron-binding protein CyaY
LWIDTRSGEELFSVLSQYASAQSGSELVLVNPIR